MKTFNITLEILPEREQIIRACKERVITDGTAYINSVASKIGLNIDEEHVQKIAYLLYATGEYEKGFATK
jgi:peptide subunit release factor RF-3